MSEMIYLGAGNHLVALDRDSGRELWRRKVPGASHIMNVVVDGDRILVASAGTVTCFRAGTGDQIWHNDLPGLGFGFVAISTTQSAGGTPAAAPAEVYIREQRKSSD